MYYKDDDSTVFYKASAKKVTQVTTYRFNYGIEVVDKGMRNVKDYPRVIRCSPEEFWKAYNKILKKLIV